MNTEDKSTQELLEKVYDIEEKEAKKEQKVFQEDIQNNKEVAASSYFLIFAPVVFITRKDSAFIQFHSAQGSILLLFFVIFWILSEYISLLGWLNFPVLLGAVVGFIQAIQGKLYKIPFVSEIIKEGVSPQKIWQGVIRASKIFMKIIIGFFPKNTGEKISETLKVDPDKAIIKRIENIEKILLQEKLFSSPHALPLSDLPAEAKEYFIKVLEKLKQKDPSLKIHSEKVFYELTGSFGTVILGGVSKEHPSNFSYAISSTVFSAPKERVAFGGFFIGKAKIGEKILL
jgi:uncharacterized membrane protein